MNTGKTDRKESREVGRRQPKKLVIQPEESYNEDIHQVDELDLKNRMHECLSKLTNLDGEQARPLHFRLHLAYKRLEDAIESFTKGSARAKDVVLSADYLSYLIDQAEDEYESLYALRKQSISTKLKSSVETQMYYPHKKGAEPDSSLYDKHNMKTPDMSSPEVEKVSSLVDKVHELPPPENDEAAIELRHEADGIYLTLMKSRSRLDKIGDSSKQAEFVKAEDAYRRLAEVLKQIVEIDNDAEVQATKSLAEEAKNLYAELILLRDDILEQVAPASEYQEKLVNDASEKHENLKDLVNRASEQQLKGIIRALERAEKAFTSVKELREELKSSESLDKNLQTEFENAYFEHQAMVYELTKTLESRMGIDESPDDPDSADLNDSSESPSLDSDTPKNPFKGGEAFKNPDGGWISRDEMFAKAREAILSAGHVVEGVQIAPQAENNLTRISDRINKVLMRRREAIDNAQADGKSKEEIMAIKASFEAELDQEYEELGEVVAFYTEITPTDLERKRTGDTGEDVDDLGLDVNGIETMKETIGEKPPEAEKSESIYYPENSENGQGVPKELADRFQSTLARLAERGFYPNNLVGVTKVRELFERMNEVRAYEADDGVYRARINSYVRVAENLLTALEDETGTPVSEPGLTVGHKSQELDIDLNKLEAEAKPKVDIDLNELEQEAMNAISLKESQAVEESDPEWAAAVARLKAAGLDPEKSQVKHVERSGVRREPGSELAMTPRREAMLESRKSQAAYEKGLQDFYKDPSWFGLKGGLRRMGKEARDIFGLAPKLSPELQALKEQAESDKLAYAKLLHQRLGERGKQELAQVDPDSESTKKAFFKRFVADSARRKLALQKEMLALEPKTAEKIEQVKKILASLGKHKWKTRVGTVLLIGALAGATGGVGAAVAAGGYSVGRMAFGMAGGALAGSGANKVFGYFGKRAEAKAGKVDEAGAQFVLDEISKLEAEYGDALEGVELWEKRRRIGVAVAGATGGFAAGSLGYDYAAEKAANISSLVSDKIDAFKETVTPTDVDALESVDNPPVTAAVETATTQDKIEIAHTVKSGDTLSQIVHRNMVAQFDSGNLNLPDGITREGLAKLMYEQYPEMRNPNLPVSEWKLSPDQWKEMGVLSGNPHLIKVGDNIDVASLIDKVAPNSQLENIVTTKPTTGTLNITPDTAGGGEIPIKTDNIVGDMYRGDTELVTPAPVPPTPEFNAAVGGPRPYTLDGNFFSNPEYQEYALGNLGSQEALDKLLDSSIKAVEGSPSPSDILFNRPSPFSLVKDLTVSEFTELIKTPGGLAELADKHGVQEELLLEWKQKFNDLTNPNLSQVPFKGTTTFGDLFQRSVVENRISQLFKK